MSADRFFTRPAPRATFPDLPYGVQSSAETLDLYLPPPGKAPAPLVLWIHGGGFRMGDKRSMPRTYFGPPPRRLGPDGPSWSRFRTSRP
ncbi:MAG TPA: hypothetical protein VEK07_02990 [Polyangiaceae bacterium]|nr:hypothetical protein [Polyangiaceae bacterium]